MTVARLEAVGFCAHYSQQGDWAFDYAFQLARQRSLQLNVFHFLSDPYDGDGSEDRELTPAERDRLIVEREKKLRFYYDSRLGDFLEAGFRLCEDRQWVELHRCLTRREFQVLVLPYPNAGATFADKPIEEFADAFVCPVVLVGPDAADQYYLNPPAALVAGSLGLTGARTAVDDGDLTATRATPAAASL